jgi:AAA15 family ATPase/GTPase
MLLSFKIKNYLSFKDEAGFSMESNKKIRTLKNNKNIIKLKD